MPSLKLAAFAVIMFAASAANASDEVSFRFSSDDLASSKSVKALYVRMDRAAENACTTPGLRGLETIKRDRLCHRQLIESFVEQVDHPSLTTVHEDQHGADRLARVN